MLYFDEHLFYKNICKVAIALFIYYTTLKLDIHYITTRWSLS